MQIPHCNVAITAATEADFWIWTNGQCIASWCTGSHLSLNPWGWCCQIPNGNCAGLTTHHQSPAIWQQLDWPNVIVSLKAIKDWHWCLAAGLTDVPNFHTSFAASVDIFGRVAHWHGTHHITVRQDIDLPSLSGDAWSHLGISWECHWSWLPLGIDVERVGPIEKIKKKHNENFEGSWRWWLPKNNNYIIQLHLTMKTAIQWRHASLVSSIKNVLWGPKKTYGLLGGNSRVGSTTPGRGGLNPLKTPGGGSPSGNGYPVIIIIIMSQRRD